LFCALNALDQTMVAKSAHGSIEQRIDAGVILLSQTESARGPNSIPGPRSHRRMQRLIAHFGIGLGLAPEQRDVRVRPKARQPRVHSLVQEVAGTVPGEALEQRVKDSTLESQPLQHALDEVQDAPELGFLSK